MREFIQDLLRIFRSRWTYWLIVAVIGLLSFPTILGMMGSFLTESWNQNILAIRNMVKLVAFLFIAAFGIKFLWRALFNKKGGGK